MIKALNSFYTSHLSSRSASTHTTASNNQESVKNTSKISENILVGNTTTLSIGHSLKQRISEMKFFKAKQQSETEPCRRILLSGSGEGDAKVRADVAYPLILGNSQSTLLSIYSERTEWVINASIMITLYETTQDEQFKRLVSFLLVNYLAKAGTLFFDEADTKTYHKLKSMFHLSHQDTTTLAYNRESPAFDVYLREKISKKLNNALGMRFHITDAKELHVFFPLSFTVIQGDEEVSQQQMLVSILDHCAKHADPLKNNLSPMLLFDLTDIIGNDLLACSDDPDNHRQCEAKLRQFEEKLRLTVEQVAATVMAKTSTLQDATLVSVQSFIIENLMCVCRGEVGEIGTLHLLPVFADPKKETCKLSKKFERGWVELENFLNGSGLRLGSVSGRSKIFNFFFLEEFQKQFGIDKTPEVLIDNVFFERKDDYVQSSQFQRVIQSFTQDTSNTYVTTIGTMTVQLLIGLFSEINEKEWDEMQGRPGYKQLIQTTLYKIEQQLNTAEIYRHDFNVFMRSIELIHYEIAALLEIFHPFTEQDFATIYHARLTIIPESLRSSLVVGLTKSGMNTCAAISSAVNELAPNAVKIIQKKSHFELVCFVGGIQKGIESALHDSTISKVDLFFTEFHHNISLFSDQGKYETVDIIGNIESLLKEKHATAHLTVAVDATIDHVNSPKMLTVFKHFESEILEGKLNFVVFRSGQKFDMAGMDNYYGSPYYMVNNRGSQWNAFNKIFKNPILNTDNLSLQWFCLANKHASNGLDAYKNALFTNTKTILASLPPELMQNSLVKICDVSPDADTCLIDIKCKGSRSERIKGEIETLFFQKLVSKGIRIHHRAGYGYFNVNINSYGFGLDTTFLSTIRINPGVNSAENQAIVEILKDVLSKKW